MGSDSCVAIIGAIAAAQVAVLGALVAAWVKLRENGQVLKEVRAAAPRRRAPNKVRQSQTPLH